MEDCDVKVNPIDINITTMQDTDTESSRVDAASSITQLPVICSDQSHEHVSSMPIRSTTPNVYAKDANTPSTLCISDALPLQCSCGQDFVRYHAHIHRCYAIYKNWATVFAQIPQIARMCCRKTLRTHTAHHYWRRAYRRCNARTPRNFTRRARVICRKEQNASVIADASAHVPAL